MFILKTRNGVTDLISDIRELAIRYTPSLFSVYCTTLRRSQRNTLCREALPKWEKGMTHLFAFEVTLTYSVISTMLKFY